MIYPASRTGLLALIGAMALASCSETAPENSDAENALASGEDMMPVEPDGGIGDGAPPPMQESPAGTIPASLQGRWGLVPADCTSTRGDAKGLLTIAPTTLTFYESQAQISDVETVGANSISADFDFEGEGMRWERSIDLEAREGGAKLIKREFGENAPGPLEYARCAADPRT
ncbi:hypothetical protein G7A66_06030 [Altererythrobacter sp. SALINAS58]|uniref:hypothetical protein n=1 Tax=Alteripontixanthobacter muriae TaxID=2705546 RepID=UPI001576246A|nr:hypothetical protein [Alteripontixanthobacter muriae]NTZ42649.1 hypothetical protein [Alteripontixanthobacter muriae]